MDFWLSLNYSIHIIWLVYCKINFFIPNYNNVYWGLRIAIFRFNGIFYKSYNIWYILIFFSLTGHQPSFMMPVEKVRSGLLLSWFYGPKKELKGMFQAFGSVKSGKKIAFSINQFCYMSFLNYGIHLLEALLINFMPLHLEFLCIFRWIRIQKIRIHLLKCDGSETLVYSMHVRWGDK